MKTTNEELNGIAQMLRFIAKIQTIINENK